MGLPSVESCGSALARGGSPFEFGIPIAALQVIVHHARGLHMGVDHRRPDEFEASFLEVLADPVRQLGARRHLLEARESIVQGLSVNQAPDVLVEGSEFPAHIEEGFGVGHRRGYLQLVADDSLVFHERRDLPGIIKGDLAEIEIVESLSEILPLSQDRHPGQAGLESFQDEELEELPVVVEGSAPFEIVVPAGEGIFRAPAAALGYLFRAHGLIVSLFLPCQGRKTYKKVIDLCNWRC